MEHPDFNRFRWNITEHRIQLLSYELIRYAVYPLDSLSVLGRQSRDDTHSVTAEGRHGFQVGLNSRSARAVAAGDTQYRRQFIFFILH